MCDLALALTLGSTLLGAAGSIQQGQAAAKAAKYNAQVAEMNATISERRAKDALDRGAFEEQQKRRENAALMGKQKAAMAANGIDLTFGSPLDMIVDSATLGELDALTIRKNAYREEYDYRVQAANQRAQKTMYEGAAKSALTGGYLAAGGTILGGAGNAYKNYYQATYGSTPG